MCLQINNEENYSFLGIRDIVDKDSNFAMLGMKEFNVVEGKTKDEVKLHSEIMSNYQYYFAKTKYGIRSLNDNTVQGRKHYCWVTSWHKSKTVVYVRNKRNENSPDSFIIKRE